jgi:hypothetical protein
VLTALFEPIPIARIALGYEQSGGLMRRTGWTLEGNMAVARSHRNEQFHEVAEKDGREQPRPF